MQFEGCEKEDPDGDQDNAAHILPEVNNSRQRAFSTVYRKGDETYDDRQYGEEDHPGKEYGGPIERRAG